MTRDGTVGRFRRNRAKPGVSSGHRSRLNDEDSVRGPHQGQQSTRTAPTGRTHDCKRPLRCTPNDLLPGGGHPHMTQYRAGRDPIPLVVMLEGADGEDAVRALNAGARAVLDRSASRNEIIAAVKAVNAGLG